MSETAVLHEAGLQNHAFQVYEHLLAPRNATHPQHQGLTYDEFVRATDNSDVVKTDIEVNGEVVSLPQLGPIEQFDWLNAPRYTQEFPAETEQGQLLHYMDLPGVDPSDEVKERLKQLAQHEGVLVFDYPSSDPEYLDRINRLLLSLGIATTEFKHLATQTYFAGETTIETFSEDRPLKSYNEVYDEEVKAGKHDLEKIENGVAMVKTVSEEDALFMDHFYEAAYTELNETEFCKQGLSPEEFMHTMTQDDETIKIVRKTDGQVASLMMLDNHLEDLSWINPEYYAKLFPERYKNGQVMWFPGLAADPNKKPAFSSQKMVNEVARVANEGNNEIVIVFDCGNRNTGALDKAVNYMINRTGQAKINIEPIAQQYYCAIKTTAA